ncbi:MAG: cytochrome c [Variibacter sp.]|jgi:cytochrome c|nr:cytochrome c [Variibacter sp.]
MDSFELNKILGAVLFTCLSVLTLNIASGALFTPKKPAKPGYEIAVPEPEAQAGGQQAAPAQDQPIETLLASADPKRGETAFKKCTACHTDEKGGPNKIGPNLYGVVNRAKGAVPGFAYSEQLKAKGGNWTFDDINHFIVNPKAFIPGTKMNFAGVPRGSERADLIAFLNAKSDSPAAMPKAAESKPQ